MTVQAPRAVIAGPELSYPQGGLLDAIIDTHAAARPEATALRYRDTAISYRELAAASRRAAAALAAAGAGPGDIVAIRCEPTPATVAALLGVLRCGAAYAALPTDWPRPRCEQVLTRSGARVLVTEDGLPWDPDLTVLALADLDLGDEDTAPGPRKAAGSDPCCVFFTSGSTGVPKAVLSSHQGIVRVALSALLDIGDVPVSLPRLAPTGWDGFAFDLWSALVRGGTTVLTDVPDFSGNGIRALVAQGVSVMFLTVSLFNSLMEDDPGCLAGLRRVVTGGERVSPEHLAVCRRHHPGLDIVNGYGPAEGTICTTYHLLPDPLPPGDVPIGRPPANTQVYVLDEDQDHTPVGVGTVGELAIAGDGVALGYLGDEAGTAARFRTLDFGDGAVRVYLTGDLVRADAEGLLWFLGRNDRQLKLRGVRIDPYELERLLEERPDVSRATVLGLPLDGPRVERLVAFYSSPGAPAAPETLIAHVAAALPAGFRPDRAVHVPRMPQLSNGKVDHRALAALVPERSGGGSDGDGSGPKTFDTLVPEQASGSGGSDAFGAVRPAPASLERLWRLADTVPHAHEAVVPMLFRVRGRFDPRVLRRAFDVVVAGNEALRSRFLHADGRFSVHIDTAKEATGLLMVDVLSGPRPIDEAEVEARRWLRSPANLVGTLPVRARLIAFAERGGDGGYLLAVSVHRIAFDDYSVSVFCEQLMEAYEAVRARQQPPSRAAQADYYPALAARDAAQPEAASAEDGLTLGPTAEDGLTLGPAAEAEAAPTDVLLTAEHAATALGVRPAALLLVAFQRLLTTYTGDPEVAVRVPLPGRSAGPGQHLGSFEIEASHIRRATGDLESVLEAERLLGVSTGPQAPAPAPFPSRFRFVALDPVPAMRTSRWTADPLPVRPLNSLWTLTLEVVTGTPAPSAVLRYRTDLIPPTEAADLASQWAAEVARLAAALIARPSQA